MRFILFFLISFAFSLSAYSQNKNTLAQCENFKRTLSADPIVKGGTYSVPYDYRAPTGKKISIFYWIRKGIDSKKPPVLLIHGGPGGNSWRYYSSFRNINYAGDVLAIDNRNEGCSHIADYKFQPENYELFRSRVIVQDLEVLRNLLYGKNKQWRIFGQSRGTTIAHHYFEMYPHTLESVQTHGFAMMSPQNMINYTFYRSHFNARGSQRFFQKFPQAQPMYLQAQDYFRKNKICLSANFLQQGVPAPQQPKVCGAVITDSISYKLSNYARWGEIANSLIQLADPNGQLNAKKATDLFQAEINGNIYVGHMNYIMGTNGRDVASPSPQTFQAVLMDPELKRALISEGRFVATAVYPMYIKTGGRPFTASIDTINFPKFKRLLQEHEHMNKRKFPFILFSSYYDTIAAPEMYGDEMRLLSPYVKLVSLANSGHEGWDTEPSVRQTIFR